MELQGDLKLGGGVLNTVAQCKSSTKLTFNIVACPTNIFCKTSFPPAEAKGVKGSFALLQEERIRFQRIENGLKIKKITCI